ncbi:MAG: hypothetical protein WCA31_13150, partial [Acidimicrobiales bacterium]
MKRRAALRGVIGSASLVLAASLVTVGPAKASPRVAALSEFDAPSGLAFGSGHLWVTNQAGDSVTEINPASGAWVASFGRAQGYLFNSPTGITRSGANLFVANAGGSVVEMAASNGALVRVIKGGSFHFNDPVAITAAGSTVLVLNEGGSGTSGSITEISARTG